jgi:DNA mismatch endonuclease (patch repair protein)
LTDIFTKKKRSQIMASITGKETKPEILIRSFLFKQGFRFRKNVKVLPGKPDIVLAKYKTVIFVHGCFWHGHKYCKAAKLPVTNKIFWKQKIAGNKKRDKKNIASLDKLGWKVLIIWQCQISTNEKRKNVFISLINSLKVI